MIKKANGYTIKCGVRFRNGNTGLASYNVYKGYQDEDALINELEKRMNIEK